MLPVTGPHLVNVIVRRHPVTTEGINLLEQQLLTPLVGGQLIQGEGQRIGGGLIPCQHKGKGLGRDLRHSTAMVSDATPFSAHSAWFLSTHIAHKAKREGRYTHESHLC